MRNWYRALWCALIVHLCVPSEPRRFMPSTKVGAELRESAGRRAAALITDTALLHRLAMRCDQKREPACRKTHAYKSESAPYTSCLACPNKSLLRTVGKSPQWAWNMDSVPCSAAVRT